MGKFQDYINKATVDGTEKLLIADTNDATPDKTKHIIISAILNYINSVGINASSIRGKEVINTPVVANEQILKFNSGSDKYEFDYFQRASESEIRTGTDNIKLITPFGLAKVLGAELVDTQTISTPVSEVVYDNLDDNHDHFFVFENLNVVNDNVPLLFQISFDGGSTWENTNYRYMVQSIDDSGVKNDQSSTGTTNGIICNPASGWSIGNAVGEFYNGTLYMFNNTKIFNFDGSYLDNNSKLIHSYGANYNPNVGIVDALRFYLSSGNIDSVKITHYKFKK